MGRSQETFSKKENEKKRIAKRKEKAEKAEERKANNDKGKGLESMLAYIDENGNISDTPPDPKKMRVVNTEDIQLGATRVESIEDGAPRQGIVTHFNDEKGYGFIRDLTTQESIFVHISGLDGGPVKEGNKVSFTVEMGQKGPNAVGVKVAS